MPRQQIALQPLLLPKRMVCVLQRQRRRCWYFALAQARVERRHLAQQDAQRRAIGDDMVEDEDQDVRQVVQPQQPHPDQRSTFQRERGIGFLLRKAAGLGFACFAGHAPRSSTASVSRRLGAMA